MQSKILIVDDEPDIEDLIKQKFRRKISSGEFQFEFAQNGKKALEKIQGDNTFAAIFTDINMPEMDGLALLEKINEMDLDSIKREYKKYRLDLQHIFETKESNR